MSLSGGDDTINSGHKNRNYNMSSLRKDFYLKDNTDDNSTNNHTHLAIQFQFQPQLLLMLINQEENLNWKIYLH